MTPEIAYELGRFDPAVFHAFYDMATWTPAKDPKFPYAAFFNWGPPHPSSPDGVNWDWSLWGALREETFEDSEHKLAYVRGQIAARGKVTETSITLSWTNSLPTRDRVTRWVNELVQRVEPFGGVRLNADTRYSIPICADLTITASPEIIRWLVGKEQT